VDKRESGDGQDLFKPFQFCSYAQGGGGCISANLTRYMLVELKVAPRPGRSAEFDGPKEVEEQKGNIQHNHVGKMKFNNRFQQCLSII